GVDAQAAAAAGWRNEGQRRDRGEAVHDQEQLRRPPAETGSRRHSHELDQVSQDVEDRLQRVPPRAELDLSRHLKRSATAQQGDERPAPETNRGCEGGGGYGAYAEQETDDRQPVDVVGLLLAPVAGAPRQESGEPEGCGRE